MSDTVKSRQPKYRRHKSSGQAIVTLPDGQGGRKDYLLGPYGTAASKREYNRLVGRTPVCAPQAPATAGQPPAAQPTSLASLLGAVRRFHALRLSLCASAIVLAVVMAGLLFLVFLAMRPPIATEQVGGRPKSGGSYRLVVPRPGQSSGEALYEQMMLDIGKK